MQLVSLPAPASSSADASYFTERYHRAFAEEGPLLLELLAAIPEGRMLLAPLTLCLGGLVDELTEHSRRQEQELFEHLAHPVVRLGARYVPTPFQASGLDPLPGADDIAGAVRRLASS